MVRIFFILIANATCLGELVDTSNADPCCTSRGKSCIRKVGEQFETIHMPIVVRRYGSEEKRENTVRKRT